MGRDFMFSVPAGDSLHLRGGQSRGDKATLAHGSRRLAEGLGRDQEHGELVEEAEDQGNAAEVEDAGKDRRLRKWRRRRMPAAIGALGREKGRAEVMHMEKRRRRQRK